MRNVSIQAKHEQINFLIRELVIWCRLGFWAGLREFADLFPWLVSLSFIGHVSTEDLAALSLVEVWIYTLMDLTWWAVSMTESVLVSQAHGCRCLLSMRGWAMMSFVVMTVCNIVLSILCLSYQDILIAFGFDKTLAERGATFAMFIIPAFYLEGVTICIATYLTAFQEASVPTYIQLISGVLDLFVTYLLIFGIADFHGMDALKASALGWIISSAVSCVLESYAMHFLWGKELTYVPETLTKINNDAGSYQNQLHIVPRTPKNDSSYIILETHSSRKKTKHLDLISSFLSPDLEYKGINSTPVSNSLVFVSLPLVLSWIWNSRRWMKYTKQALPNFATTGMQSLSMFVMAMLAAKLGNLEIAAHNCSVALFEVLYTVVQGMGEGTSIRISYHVGQGNIQAAKVVMWISFFASLLWGIFVASAGYLFRHEIACVLSNDPEVQFLSSSLAPLVWGSYAVFSIGGQCLAVLDGQGRAAAQAFSFLVGSWLVSVPLFFLSALQTDWGLDGLWVSLIAGYLVTVIVSVILISKSDWQEIVANAKDRISAEYTNSDEISPCADEV